MLLMCLQLFTVFSGECVASACNVYSPILYIGNNANKPRTN